MNSVDWWPCSSSIALTCFCIMLGVLISRVSNIRRHLGILDQLRTLPAQVEGPGVCPLEGAPEQVSHSQNISGSRTVCQYTLPPRPEEPSPEDCCQSGCVNCVWDIYRKELEEWNELAGSDKGKVDSALSEEQRARRKLVETSLDAFEALERQLASGR